MTAKIIRNGNNQTVSLPEEFHFDCDEVVIERQGDKVVLYAEKPSFIRFLDNGGFTDDMVKAIMEARENDVLQEREEL